MASVYSVFADRIEYDTTEVWADERDVDVLYGRIAFWPDAERWPRHWLCLNREWVVAGRVEQYEGPVVTAIEGADVEGGISRAELGRDHLRIELDSAAAARIEDDRVLVQFDLDDTEFATLRRELVEMFKGLGVLRVQGAELGALPDTVT